MIAVDHAWKADQTAKESGEKISADQDAYYLWRRTRMADDIGKIIALREARAENAEAVLLPA